MSSHASQLCKTEAVRGAHGSRSGALYKISLWCHHQWSETACSICLCSASACSPGQISASQLATYLLGVSINWMGTPLIILDSSSWPRTALHWWPSGPVIECLDVTDGWFQSSLYLAPAPGITPSWLQHPALHPALHHPDLLTAAQCQLLCRVCPMCPPANAHNWLWWREEWQNYPDITG